jgi:DNA-binding XRE family transcriptional regulator/uncharacterized phage-associated protein
MSASNILLTLREQKSLSQEFMAQLIDVSRPSYVAIEAGRKELTISQAQKMADFFQISFSAFIRGEISPLADLDSVESGAEQPRAEEVRISIPQHKTAIFREVLLYSLNKVGGKPNVGQTVLYKLLYFIDFDFYELHEKQLIGAKYMHNHFGPTPVGFNEIIEQMQAAGELEQVNSDYFNFPQTKYLARREANLAVIGDAIAIKHIDKEIDRLADKSASELTELSHKDVPWISAKHGELLDYEAVFYRTAETSQRAYGSGIDL